MVKTKKKTKIDKTKCSPKNSQNYFSCFNKKSLIKIIKSWNKYYPKSKIVYKDSQSVSVLWKKIDTKFKKVCSNEWCWVNQPVVKDLGDDEIKNTFKPRMPSKWASNKNEWLTTTDIQNVLKQYQQKYSDFMFIGAVPIDFDKVLDPGHCVINELCKINLTRMLKKNKTKLGVVFNLDPHDQPGSHWVALYGDFVNNMIFYFDSYGVEPPEEVITLMKRLQKQGLDNNKNIKLMINKVRHQYKGSECGVYSINFIVKLLEGENYKKIMNTPIDDDTMEKNRFYFYLQE